MVLISNDNCTYSCTYNHIKALEGLTSGVRSTVIIG